MKKIKLLFKSGTTVDVNYSSKLFLELVEFLGKDHKVEAKNFSVNTKNLEGVFFEVSESKNQIEEN